MKYSAASRLVCLSDVCRFSPSAVTNVVYFPFVYFSELGATFTASQLLPSCDSPSVAHH